jgi:hypothetical protein
MARVIAEETDVDSEDVVVRKVVPKARTSPLAVIVLIAFFATCAMLFFGGAIRSPGEVTQPAAAPTATTPTTPAPAPAP